MLDLSTAVHHILQPPSQLLHSLGIAGAPSALQPPAAWNRSRLLHVLPRAFASCGLDTTAPKICTPMCSPCAPHLLQQHNSAWCGGGSLLVLLLLLMGDSVVLLLSSSPFCRCAKPKCYLVHVHSAAGCKREAQGRRRGAAEHVTAISGAAVGSPGVMFGFLVFGDPSSGVLSINELLGLELRIGIRALGLQLGSGFLH